jgi:hypothetical protein
VPQQQKNELDLVLFDWGEFRFIQQRKRFSPVAVAQQDDLVSYFLNYFSYEEKLLLLQQDVDVVFVVMSEVWLPSRDALDARHEGFSWDPFLSPQFLPKNLLFHTSTSELLPLGKVGPNSQPR